MRKIGSEREIAEKRKRNSLLIGAFILLILVLGTVGYGFLSNPNLNSGTAGADYEEGKVTEINGRWEAIVNGQVYYFSNSIETIKNISVDESLNINDFSGVNLYIDANNTAIMNELYQNLRYYSLKISEGCYGSCDRDIPEKDCSDNLIVWRDSIENRVYQEEKCIFIEGDLRAVDAFLYKILQLN